jgi:hypothetical protein
MAMQSRVQRLAEAGLLDAAALDQEDRDLIEQLTDAEVTALTQIANRLYPEDRAMIKVTDLGKRRPRICVPL